MSLQEALKMMRSELGITQAELAKKLKKALISVNRWENGKGFPSRSNAVHILDIAKSGPVSDDCLAYLNETLMPETKRGKSAAAYGFPDIDRDFLFQLADGSTNPLYVIEADSYNLLYANRAAEKAAAKFRAEKGESIKSRNLLSLSDRRCFHYFGGAKNPCPFCPLGEFDDSEFRNRIITIPETGTKIRVHAKLTATSGRRVYAIYLTDITDCDNERHALYELTNDIPDGIAIYSLYNDEHIELAFMNEAFYKMIGPEKKEKLLKSGDSDLCLVHPDDKQLIFEEIKKALTGNRNLNLKLRMRVYDGRYHRLCLDGKLIRRDTEKMTFYCRFRSIEDETRHEG